MKRQILLALAFALVLTGSAAAHDLFMKLDSYFLSPNKSANVRLLNGTFQKSDGVIARDRLRDISVSGPNLSGPINQSVTWRDEGETTLMTIKTGGPGTYLVGVSTKPREIDLKAADFNDYLQHDGIPDILSERQKNNELDKNVRERYSKHVRAVFQVGDKLSDDYKRELNYPAEVIPQENPYRLKVGDTINLLCTVDGRPVPNQFVMAGWESRDGILHYLSERTNGAGLASFKLVGAGKWYVKFIHMTALSQSNLNYESKWASLTFEIQNRKRGS
ncbi:MAG TPA: DUF4198 domain-containing protein [Pyrinomonadaceae bacterium]|nr:DUF4198 domain-containing protein [Pyrinomonadaceae bacterium]